MKENFVSENSSSTALLLKLMLQLVTVGKAEVLDIISIKLTNNIIAFISAFNRSISNFSNSLQYGSKISSAPHPVNFNDLASHRRVHIRSRFHTFNASERFPGIVVGSNLR
jgi:hypothetical protein